MAPTCNILVFRIQDGSDVFDKWWSQ